MNQLLVSPISRESQLTCFALARARAPAEARGGDRNAFGMLDPIRRDRGREAPSMETGKEREGSNLGSSDFWLDKPMSCALVYAECKSSDASNLLSAYWVEWGSWLV